MEQVMKRKVRKDFDPTKEYSVDVSKCTEEEKKDVQQAFFDVGIFWGTLGEAYVHIDAVRYTNATVSGNVTAYLMYNTDTEGCNMTAKEFLELVYEPEQQGHVHAELMAQYAEDARNHKEPWKLWELRAKGGKWYDCTLHPYWLETQEFRRKPKTHVVHGVEIPDLRIRPKEGQGYCHPDASTEYLVRCAVCRIESSWDIHRITNNLCYEPSEEGKQAAILHAKAWLGMC